MKLRGKATTVVGTALLFGALAVAGVDGCSRHGATPLDSVDVEGTGGLALQLGPNSGLDAVTYQISGPNGFSLTGTLDVSHSSTVSATIGGLPAGTGFAIALSGASSDGTPCGGSASFDVVARQVTTVAVHLTCHEAGKTGSVAVTGTINVCPVIDGISASTGETRVGSAVALTAIAHDSDGGPSLLTLTWTASSGTLGSTTGLTPTFTCTAPGTATITATASDGDATPGCTDTLSLTVSCHALPPLNQLGHLVVIYLENHSFDNLYGNFPGAEGLASPGAKIPQVDDSGVPFATLPQVDPNVPLGLPNVPFDITRFVPETQKTIDLVHRYYQEQSQIDGGKMDAFVNVSDAKGLSFGYYPTATLPLVQLISTMPNQVTVCDHFFHAAFGGSFLNHFWLIAAQTPTFPGAPASIVAQLDASGALIKDGQVTPDGFVVNTSYSVNTPHPATASPTVLVPNQTFPNIGDRLSAAGVDWAWYAGGWNDALAGNPDPLFQFHHQPFAYFANYADGTAAKAQHLKDETDFLAGVAAGKLPPVSFVKPLGPDNEHPGYADLSTGENHVVGLIKSLMASPLWADTAVIVTYDEHGGFWDHVPPPVVDRWGPGSRVPGIVFSPFAKGGVDATSYDTTAILKLIEKRWGLAALGARDAAQADLSTHALATAPSPNTADVQAILNAKCVSCHSGPTPSRGLDWTDVRAKIGVLSKGCGMKALIASGNATASYLVDKVKGAAQDGGCFSGGRMPQGQPPLADSDIATITAWINAGTP